MSSAIEEEEEILRSIFPDEFEQFNVNTFKIRVDIDRDEAQCKNPRSFSNPSFRCRLD